MSTAPVSKEDVGITHTYPMDTPVRPDVRACGVYWVPCNLSFGRGVATAVSMIRGPHAIRASTSVIIGYYV
ncbi:hypothetical protein TNCV_4644641 [Trichonephila clavipes]|nr:hypothetical protein TNCV_4644641 [Trichonephila clavipes]